MTFEERASSELTLSERQRRIKSIVVTHYRFTEATNALSQFHYPVEGGDPDTGSLALLVGDSRTGKTFASKRYLNRFPSSIGETGLILPTLYVDVPIDGGPRGLLESIADALGLTHSLRTNNPTLLASILQTFQDRRVELLVLDEAQEVFRDDNKRLLNYARGLIRKILNLKTLNVVAIGLEQTYRLMYDDPQLTGRGGLQYRRLAPYCWDSDDERALFQALCFLIDRELPFSELSGLRKMSVAYPLFWVTRGNIGRLMDFIFSAGCLALNDAASHVERRHFAEAYERRKPPGLNFNPFIHDMAQAPKPDRPVAPRSMATTAMFSKRTREDD